MARQATIALTQAATGALGGARIAWRLPVLLLLLFGGLATAFIVFPLLRRVRRERIGALWSRVLLRTCGVRLSESWADDLGPLAELPAGAMLLLNHVSWLDVFLLMARAPSHFVAKAEIRRWPLLGALAAGAGTLFIERGRRHAVHQLNQRIETALRDGCRIAVFPEGTTGTGDDLQPFHANLIEAALRAGAPVIPIGLRYRGLDGGPTLVTEFVGNINFVESLLRILAAPGVIGELHRLPTLLPDRRHVMAESARRAIAERLGVPLVDAVPAVIRGLRERRV